MTSLSQFLSQLRTNTMVFFTMLLLKLLILVRIVTGKVWNSNDRTITTIQYLELIEEKNPTVRFKGELRLEPIECSVCLSALEKGEEIRKLICNHTFHKACLDRWLQQDRATCPLCRSKILPEEVVIRHRRWRDNQQEYDVDVSHEAAALVLLSAHGNNFYRLF